MNTKMTREERFKYVIARRDAGEKFSAIGKDLGVSGQRVAQIYHQGKRYLAAKSRWYCGLSIRAHNCISRAFWPDFPKETDTKSKVAKAVKTKIETGQLRLNKIRGCGYKTQYEICDWLGLPRPVIQQAKVFEIPNPEISAKIVAEFKTRSVSSLMRKFQLLRPSIEEVLRLKLFPILRTPTSQKSPHACET